MRLAPRDSKWLDKGILDDCMNTNDYYDKLRRRLEWVGSVKCIVKGSGGGEHIP